MQKFPDFKKKKILILGLGLLGRGLKDAIFFAKKGARVKVTDLKTEEELTESLEKLKEYDIQYTLGEHKKEDIAEANLIIRNAGVPLKSEFLQYAFTKKIPVDMDESLFAKYCPCPIIGITGTRGKTTTTKLISTVLSANIKNKKIYTAGNLQGEATLPLIDQVTKDDFVILELSSWQLQGFAWNKISPHIAVFTNIYEDHLNSYANMNEYITDKKNIFKFQKQNDFCIINKENVYTKKLEPEIKSNLIWFNKKQVPSNWQPIITGEHNLENIAACLQVGKILGLKNSDMKEAVEKFPGVEHRFEFVKELNNIKFINDSASTTPISGQKALSNIKTPIILLAGGATKNIDLTPLAKDIVKKVKSVILLEGTATENLEKLLIKFGGENLIAKRTNNFAEAIELAYSISVPGDTILLSPGCASFGMFKNEFDRGAQFKQLINKLR